MFEKGIGLKCRKSIREGGKIRKQMDPIDCSMEMEFAIKDTGLLHKERGKKKAVAEGW